MRSIPYLQSHLTGIEMSLVLLVLVFPLALQSHLTGIEIGVPVHVAVLAVFLQSHLTGIEIKQFKEWIETDRLPSIAPYWN